MSSDIRKAAAGVFPHDKPAALPQNLLYRLLATGHEDDLLCADGEGCEETPLPGFPSR